MKQMNYLKFFAVSCLVLVFACGQSLAATTISMVGTDDAEELMEDLVAEFMEIHEDIKIDLGEGEGTGQGIRAAGTDEVNFGITARALTDNEALYNLKQIEFGQIPVTFAVNPAVGITNLTVAQTVDLYSGKITNWSQINGPDMPVRLIKRPKGESTQNAMRSSLNGWSTLKISSKSKTVQDEDDVLELISEKKGTIGFSVLGEVEENDLKPIVLDGIAAGDANYPIHTPLGLVYKEDQVNEAMEKFLAFVLSDAAHAILKKYHIIPK